MSIDRGVFSRAIASLILPFVFYGCSAAQKLEDYPRREIDRPFTLPKELATWSGWGRFQREQVKYSWGQRYYDNSWIPIIPLYWRQSLSDRWNLQWAPIPLAAMYQIRADKEAVTGLTFGPALKCCSSNWSVGAYAQYSHRQILNESIALEIQPALQPWVPVGEDAVWDLQAFVTTGVLYQAHDLFALRGGLIPSLRRDPRLVIDGSWGGSDSNIQWDYSWRFAMPVYAGFVWSAGRQWDLTSTLMWQRIGEGQDYSNLSLSYGFVHYW